MLNVLKAIGATGLAVPFQGEGPQTQALLTGTVMATTSTPAVAVAGNLPVLAALSDERIATLPAVPTMRELGFPAEGFTAGGLIAPTATRDEVIAVLEKACGEAASASEYKAIVERLNERCMNSRRSTRSRVAPRRVGAVKSGVCPTPWTVASRRDDGRLRRPQTRRSRDQARPTRRH
jgi:hypothetical protein